MRIDHPWLRGTAFVSASFALALLVHWTVTGPTLAGAHELRAPVFVELLLGARPGTEPPPELFRRINLWLIAATTVGAALLALVLALRAREVSGSTRLAASLGMGSASAAYFFFVLTHPVYLAFPGLGEAGRVVAGSAAYSAAFCAAWWLARFFRAYPRLPTEEEQVRFHHRMQEERYAKAAAGWRSRVLGGVLVPRRSKGVVGAALEREQLKAQLLSIANHPWLVPAMVLLAMACVAVDAWGSRGARAIAWSISFMVFVLALGEAFKGLQFHHRNAVPEDRARIDWIHGTLVVSGMAVSAIPPLWWAALLFLLPALEHVPGARSGFTALFGPMAIAVELMMLSIVLALALSIFSRGAVDPRLALRRVTLFGVIGLLVALLFIAVERVVVTQLVAWLGLSVETGVLVAGSVVAGTLAPLRGWAERRVDSLVARFLPLQALVAGERKALAIVLCDLSGYTRLSAVDEGQALLQAALLQRQAEQATSAEGGRVVKSMGDAVMLAFPDAAGAARAMGSLHAGFAPAARVLGLAPLPLHTGAHYGEVTETRDGDLYGQTVNIAARLQGEARDGQQIVSAAFAQAAALGGRCMSLGARPLKNVPEPVECFELGGA